MKALDKDRSRRYDTAASVAADVSRYLGDEPIEARPPTARYRLRKFVGRNRGPMLAVTFALVLLFTGTTTTVIMFLRARENAEIARKHAETAENNARMYRETLVGLQEEVYQRYLRTCLLGSGDPDKTLMQAKRAQLPDHELAVLRGLTAYHDSRYIEAIQHLEQAEKSAASLATMALAKLLSGDGHGFAQSVIELNQVTPVTEEDYLMLAELYFIPNTERSLEYLKNAGTGVLERVVWAAAAVHDANFRQDISLLQRATDTVNAARLLHPNDSYVLCRYVHIHYVAFKVAQRLGDARLADDCRAKALKAADELNRDADKIMTRACLWADVGRYGDAMSEFEAHMRGRPLFYAYWYADISVLAGQTERAIQRLKSCEKSREMYVDLALARIYAHSGDPKLLHDARKSCRDAIGALKYSDARHIALQGLLMTGDYLTAKRCARKIVGDSIELALPVMAHIRFIGGEIDANELLDTTPHSNFDVALVAYCQGDMARAERHFRVSADQDFAYGDAWASKVFLRRIEAAKSQSQLARPSLNRTLEMMLTNGSVKPEPNIRGHCADSARSIVSTWQNRRRQRGAGRFSQESHVR